MTVLGKMAYVQGLNGEESQDAVQECFLVFFKKLESVRDDVKLSTFLFGIFTNSVRETRRKRGRASSSGDLESLEHLIDQNYDESGHWLSQSAPLPLNGLLDKEDSTQFQECLQALPEKHQNVVLALVNSEIDGKELCHTLGLTYVNFRQLLTRARNALRLCLENYAKEDEHA